MVINRALMTAVMLILLLATSWAVAHTPPGHAKVYFIGLKDGAVVKSPFKVKFGIMDFGITPAGTKGKQREAFQQGLHNPAMRPLLRLEQEQHRCAISVSYL